MRGLPSLSDTSQYDCFRVVSWTCRSAPRRAEPRRKEQAPQQPALAARHPCGRAVCAKQVYVVANLDGPHERDGTIAELRAEHG